MQECGFSMGTAPVINDVLIIQAQISQSNAACLCLVSCLQLASILVDLYNDCIMLFTILFHTLNVTHTSLAIK